MSTFLIGFQLNMIVIVVEAADAHPILPAHRMVLRDGVFERGEVLLGVHERLFERVDVCGILHEQAMVVEGDAYEHEDAEGEDGGLVLHGRCARSEEGRVVADTGARRCRVGRR